MAFSASNVRIKTLALGLLAVNFYPYLLLQEREGAFELRS
jgi:hypothetical protein